MKSTIFKIATKAGATLRFPAIRLLLALFAASLTSTLVDAKQAASYQESKDIVYITDAAEVIDPELQSLDIYWKTPDSHLPVIIYVHGGGWAFGDKTDVHTKPDYFLGQDIAFISMNYRLRWDYNIFDQAEDLVSVIAWVKKNAAAYGLNSEKIILMGNGAGAHLVSLVATNENFLKSANLSLSDITTVVAINTASFDISRVMLELGTFIERRQHKLIFGDDEKVWRQASPAYHVGKNKGIPAFAIMFPSTDESSKIQAMDFAKKLNDASVEALALPDNVKQSGSIDANLGTEGDIPTLALMAFLNAKL